VSARLRLVLDPPRFPALNLAIDEMLMESQRDPRELPALRVYSWERPAYSIGYFQSVDETVKRYRCREKNMPVVRRITGGGLVHHGADVTFSLTLKDPNPFLPAGVKASYLKVNEAVLAGLQRAIPALDYADCKKIPSGRAGHRRVCFESPSCYDLMLQDTKVAGASQRRKSGVLLHQSALLLKENPGKVLSCVLEGFRKAWGAVFEEKPLSAEELAAARRIERERYASPGWAFPVLPR
jgi:lipoate-protein ligase A